MDIEMREVIKVAVEAGEILLRNGAETYRVEESITKICNGYGYSCDTFVLPTGIFLTVHSPNQGSETSVRRIRVRSTLNLEKIDRINTFSRNLPDNPCSYDEAMKELNAIKSLDFYPVPVQFICAAIVTFVYAILFGGSVFDGFAALLIGGLAHIINLRLIKSGFFPFLIFFALGFFCGFSGLLSEFLFKGSNVYIIIISSVIMYLPGVAMTNGVRDLLGGDPVSGLIRLGEGVLTIAAIGMGVGLAISILHFLI